MCPKPRVEKGSWENLSPHVGFQRRVETQKAEALSLCAIQGSCHPLEAEGTAAWLPETSHSTIGETAEYQAGSQAVEQGRPPPPSEGSSVPEGRGRQSESERASERHLKP